jgi:hypothetical protein
MPEIAQSDVMHELQRLLDLAGTDEYAANQGFAALLETYGHREVAPALATVIGDYMYLNGELSTAPASIDYIRPRRTMQLL